MCLINELARYNKTTHQYKVNLWHAKIESLFRLNEEVHKIITFLGLQLTDESGPAHKKSFTVCLLVGDEEYNASGPSIKKAQHAAAAIALEKTKLKHPPPKQRVVKNRES